MVILKQKHQELSKLEEDECHAFAFLEEVQFDLKLKEADILLTTSKEDWKELGITNESGRKAYITKETEDLLKEVKEYKKELKYIKLKQDRCKRIINYYMAKIMGGTQ